MVGLIMSWTEKSIVKWTSKKCFTGGLIRNTKVNLRYVRAAMVGKVINNKSVNM